MKKVVRGILIGFGVLLIAGIISSCYLNNEEKHWDNVRTESKKRKANNKESTSNNSSSNKSGRTLSVRLGNNKLITALDNDFMQLYDVYSMDDPAIYQRYIDTNSNSSFRVLKGSTVLENEISGYDVTGYGVCKSGNDSPYMAIVSMKMSLSEYGYVDTTTLLNDFMTELMPIYLNLFQIDTSSIDLYNGEKYIFGNSHAAIINKSGTIPFAVIGDANDSVTMIFVNDPNAIDIMDVVANFEPFESDGHKFIKDPDRDLVYMDNIKDIF